MTSRSVSSSRNDHPGDNDAEVLGRPKKRRGSNDEDAVPEVIEQRESRRGVSGTAKSMQHLPSRRRQRLSSSTTPSAQPTTLFGTTNTSTPPPTYNESWDLESALHKLVSIGSADGKSIRSSVPSTTTTVNQRDGSHVSTADTLPTREFLTEGRDCWIQFRVGHAGDAAVLASCYYRRPAATSESDEPTVESCRASSTATGKSERSSKNSQSTSVSVDEDATSALAVRLADALGDEDHPPSVFCLLAEVVQAAAEEATGSEAEPLTSSKAANSTVFKAVTKLGAAALLTLNWEDGAETGSDDRRRSRSDSDDLDRFSHRGDSSDSTEGDDRVSMGTSSSAVGKISPVLRAEWLYVDRPGLDNINRSNAKMISKTSEVDRDTTPKTMDPTTKTSGLADLVERRMWLRLSTLALMLSSKLQILQTSGTSWPGSSGLTVSEGASSQARTDRQEGKNLDAE